MCKEDIVCSASFRRGLREILLPYCEASRWEVAEEIVDLIEKCGKGE